MWSAMATLVFSYKLFPSTFFSVQGVAAGTGGESRQETDHEADTKEQNKVPVNSVS